MRLLTVALAAAQPFLVALMALTSAAAAREAPPEVVVICSVHGTMTVRLDEPRPAQPKQKSPCCAIGCKGGCGSTPVVNLPRSFELLETPRIPERIAAWTAPEGSVSRFLTSVSARGPPLA